MVVKSSTRDSSTVDEHSERSLLRQRNPSLNPVDIDKIDEIDTTPTGWTLWSRLSSYFSSSPSYTSIPSNSDATPPKRSMLRDLRGDFANVFVLLLLYTLQGIPMGISMTIPLIMQERNVAYASQAVFSIVTLPFSFKLLWAPLVDSYYFRSIGRRKSWMLPTQVLCGLGLLLLGPSVDEWIGHVDMSVSANADTHTVSPMPVSVSSSSSSSSAAVPQPLDLSGASRTDLSADEAAVPAAAAVTAPDDMELEDDDGSSSTGAGDLAVLAEAPTHASSSTSINVTALSSFFLFLYFLMATQDIAVDAWALTMLRRRNVGWASTANNVGQYLGIYLAHVGYLIFSSPETCNKYLRSADSQSEYGIINLASFMQLCGVLFLATTIFVGFCKSESTLHPVDVLADAVAAIKASKPDVDVKSLVTVDVDVDIDESEDNVRLVKLRSVNNDRNTGIKGGADNDGSYTDDELLAIATIKKNNVHLPVVLSELPDNETAVPEEDSLSIWHTFERIKNVLKLPAVIWLVVFLLTHRIGTAPADYLTQPKLFERGFTKSDVALIVSLVSPLTVIVPMLCSSISTGPRAFASSYASIPLRVALGAVWAVVVYLYPLYKHDPSFYTLLVTMMALQTILCVFQSVVAMSFFAKIADPRIGGTFMTLLNTAANFGGSSTRMFSMYSVDKLTSHHCVVPEGTYGAAMGVLTTAKATNAIGDAFSVRHLSYLQRLGMSLIQSLRVFVEPLVPAAWVSHGALRPHSDVFEKTLSVGMYACKDMDSVGNMCKTVGGECITYVDGYFVEIMLFSLVGLVWLAVMWTKLKHLDSLPLSAWRVELK